METKHSLTEEQIKIETQPFQKSDPMNRTADSDGIDGDDSDGVDGDSDGADDGDSDDADY